MLPTLFTYNAPVGEFGRNYSTSQLSKILRRVFVTNIKHFCDISYLTLAHLTGKDVIATKVWVISRSTPLKHQYVCEIIKWIGLLHVSCSIRHLTLTLTLLSISDGALCLRDATFTWFNRNLTLTLSLKYRFWKYQMSRTYLCRQDSFWFKLEKS